MLIQALKSILAGRLYSAFIDLYLYRPGQSAHYTKSGRGGRLENGPITIASQNLRSGPYGVTSNFP